MVLKLYLIDRSPPATAVLMTANALNITLEQILLDFSNNEHLRHEYLKLNPQHTVPTLDDNGIILWDSHAINVYLVSKYEKDDSLYPQDLYKRAVVNQRLYFDSGVMYPVRKAVVKHVIKSGLSTVSSEKIDNVLEAYGFLEAMLKDHHWMAGDTLTLADLNLIPTVTFSSVVVPIQDIKFPNLSAWIKRIQTLPFYYINQKALDSHKRYIEQSLKL